MQPFTDLKYELQQRLLGYSVAEPQAITGADDAPNEYFVQAVWAEQLLKMQNATTVCGKPVLVLEAGQWNHEGGPDFRTAELEIGGKRLRGDIEIHLNASDWGKHHHARDFEYNRVVLHAFLYNDDGLKHDELQNGERVERLELLPLIDPDLDTVMRALSRDDYAATPASSLGRCHAVVSRLDDDFLLKFFLASSRDRMRAKIERLEAQLSGETHDQVFYQTIMTAMGYKGSKTLFFLLAKRTPVEEMKTFLRNIPLPELSIAIEAILLNVANLIAPKGGADAAPGELFPRGEAVCEGPALDAATQQYIDKLHGWWAKFGGYYQDRIIPPTRRWYTGVRPVNFPARRIAGIAAVLAAHDFREGLLVRFERLVEGSRARTPKTSRDFRREIIGLCHAFALETSGYWTRRYVLGGKETQSNMQLIGADRAASLVLNALLPMLLLRARQAKKPEAEQFLWRLYDHFPALQENSVTKFMRHRLFGTAAPPALNFRLEKMNQALIHIFQDCCNDNALTCDDCCFYQVEKTRQ